MKTAKEIQADFDRIALAEPLEVWNHNHHYHEFLMRFAPAHCSDALEVGCGTGAFARLLAARSDHVLALDLSDEMLRIAREHSTAFPQIEYVQADVMEYPLPGKQFDCIASIATLHHLNLAEVLTKLKAALKPEGVLLVLDLCRDEGLGDFFQSVAAVPLHLALKRIKNGNQPQTAEARAAWDAHGQSDVYLSVRQVREVCADILPGAQVKRHLLWRYSLLWTNV